MPSRASCRSSGIIVLAMTVVTLLPITHGIRLFAALHHDGHCHHRNEMMRGQCAVVTAARQVELQNFDASPPAGQTDKCYCAPGPR